MLRLIHALCVSWKSQAFRKQTLSVTWSYLKIETSKQTQKLRNESTHKKESN